MHHVDIPKFRKEVQSILEHNREKIKSIETKEDGSILMFTGKRYACEIQLTDDWIGYDLMIKTPAHTVGCGITADTDIYPIKGDHYEEIALEIYDDLLMTVNAILNGEVYYKAAADYAYTSRKNSNGTYYLSCMKRRKFLFLPFTSGWKREDASRAEIEALSLDRLS